MTAPAWRWWPRTLFARLTLILFAGLVLAHALSFKLIFYERTEAGKTMMLGHLEQDIASAVALLERLPAAERRDWLPLLARDNYHLLLEAGTGGAAPDSERTSRVLASIAGALGPHHRVSANLLPGSGDRLQVHVQLSDGSPLTIDLQLRGMPLSPWLPLVLLAQLALISMCTWLAVRLATRPLAQLATAANRLGPDLNGARLSECGPTEVAHAATAFNAMQDRIAASMRERMQILAAISHDLQTPITRMRLRADTGDGEAQGAAMQRDLLEMEALVREGVAYAKTLHAAAEVPRRVDPDALFDSLACDYADAGQAVTLEGRIGRALVTRPQAVRRILTNLIDNALKFAGAAQLSVSAAPGGQVTIRVLDRGAGIAEQQLEAVFQPFFRLESSRNRDTGGTGLGLAIARQLANAMGAALSLHNRAGGGLEARLTLPADAGDSGKLGAPIPPARP
jgi:signal transduction histidine kinase